MKQHHAPITRVGVDLAQSVIQIHAVDAVGAVVVAKQLQRSAFLPWCEQLPAGCIVAMEASCAAHYWARRLSERGLTVRLISPSFVTPYRMSGPTGKTDANDAAAICEAASRPQMRFVPVKSPAQQSVLALHSVRDGFVKERITIMNRARGLLSEFGILFPLSRSKFRTELLRAIAMDSDDLTPLARMVLRRCLQHFDSMDRQISWCDAQIAKHVARDPNAKLARTVLGVGPLSASALVATAGDLSQFKNGRQFSAWLGLVPRTNSSGAKQQLGSITKRGDDYLRRLLVLGARSAVVAAPSRDDATSKWAVQLRARIGGPKAYVAMANRNARRLWSLLTHQPNRSAHPHG